MRSTHILWLCYQFHTFLNNSSSNPELLTFDVTLDVVQLFKLEDESVHSLFQFVWAGFWILLIDGVELDLNEGVL